MLSVLVICINIAKLQAQSKILIDYSTKVAAGSNLMLGGNNYGFSSKAICDMHKQAGFNIARYDAMMNDIVPASTIANYKNNVNNIQDSKLWNWQRIDNDLEMLTGSKFKILLIIDYCPIWLGNPQQQKDNIINTMPVNWEVYEDIVKKVFLHVQKKVYAVEIWNEPDWGGFRIEGSGYKDAVTAYLDLYYHTATALRAVNKTIKIGGPAAAITYDTRFFEAMLNDKRIKSNFDFYSYHYYGVQKPGTVKLLKRIATKYNRPDLPVFITEWNFTGDFNKNPMNSESVDAISFIGDELINQYREGASLSILYCMDDYNKATNFFTMDANGVLVPKVSVIRLMSVKLGLGLGKSAVFKTTINGVNINGFGAINSAGKPIICMVNKSQLTAQTDILIQKTKLSGKKNVRIFEASVNNKSNSVLKTISVIFKNGNAAISKFLVPKNTVIGIEVQP